jgi:hypothetical protein
MTPALEHDINRQTDAKLRQWFIDSMALYEMADLPIRIALVNITILLMTATGRLTAEIGTSPEEAGKAMSITVMNYQKDLDKKRAKP